MVFRVIACVDVLVTSCCTTYQVAVWRDLNVLNSFTIEASFCGSDDGPHQDTHYNTTHYEVRPHPLFPVE